MIQIEVGFKIKEDKLEAEKILLNDGFINTFKTAHTRDIYFGKNNDFDDKSEKEIKDSLVRLRGSTLFENLKLLDENIPDGKINVDFTTAVSYFNRLFKAGYKVVFDTEKTDWIYKKGKYIHQLQDIKGIGLVDYVYFCEPESGELNEDKLFSKLKEEMNRLGFTLEYELGVDKLKSLHKGKLQFSKSQYYSNDKSKNNIRK